MSEKKGFITEFKEFIARGNVMDMAVGIIIGTAFTAIVNSIVNDVIMPAIGFLIGGLDFTQYKIVLTEATADAADTAIYYGTFIQNLVNFLIIAFVVFLLVKGINKLHRKKEEAPPEPEAVDPQIELLTEIRDLLNK